MSDTAEYLSKLKNFALYLLAVIVASLASWAMQTFLKVEAPLPQPPAPFVAPQCDCGKLPPPPPGVN